MKAISLLQPWATLLVLGAARGGKGIETRSWGTRYRGPLWVHASRRFDAGQRLLCHDHPFVDALEPRLRPPGWPAAWPSYDRMLDALPRGAIIGRVDLVEIRRIRTSEDVPPEPERSFGDYRPGRRAWVTRDPLFLPDPVPCRGRRGVWEVPPEAARAIVAVLR